MPSSSEMSSSSDSLVDSTELKNAPLRIDKDVDSVLDNGCLSIVVLGASGDLAKKKTFPALFHLFKQV